MAVIVAIIAAAVAMSGEVRKLARAAEAWTRYGRTAPPEGASEQPRLGARRVSRTELTVH